MGIAEQLPAVLHWQQTEQDMWIKYRKVSNIRRTKSQN